MNIFSFCHIISVRYYTFGFLVVLANIGSRIMHPPLKSLRTSVIFVSKLEKRSTNHVQFETVTIYNKY